MLQVLCRRPAPCFQGGPKQGAKQGVTGQLRLMRVHSKSTLIANLSQHVPKSSLP